MPYEAHKFDRRSLQFWFNCVWIVTRYLRNSPLFISDVPLYHLTLGIGFPPDASHIKSTSSPSPFGPNTEELVRGMWSRPYTFTLSGTSVTNQSFIIDENIQWMLCICSDFYIEITCISEILLRNIQKKNIRIYGKKYFTEKYSAWVQIKLPIDKIPFIISRKCWYSLFQIFKRHIITFTISKTGIIYDR